MARHGKGGCTSKRKKGGCVARTPVSTSPAGGYSALLDVHSAQAHYMLFPLGEWHPRHWGAFQAGLSTRCFTTRSQLNLSFLRCHVTKCDCTVGQDYQSKSYGLFISIKKNITLQELHYQCHVMVANISWVEISGFKMSYLDITLYQRYLTLIVMFNELLLSVEKPAYHASQVWSQWDQGDKDWICEEKKDNSKLQIWRNIENENIIWQK